jgi:hypothetical protein
LFVRLRARDACEYCLLPTTVHFEIDHVIPARLWPLTSSPQGVAVAPRRQRSGPHHIDNFAWACPSCNRGKRDQITGKSGRRQYRLFDPRHDRWRDHFYFLHGYLLIMGVPGIGRATAQALRFNDARPEGSVGTRHEAIMAGRYPPPWAREWFAGR